MKLGRYTMSQRIDLKGLERKASTSYLQDGLLDIFLGLSLLAMGVFLLVPDAGVSDSAGLLIFVGLLALALLLLGAGKRYITIPRIGRAEFSEERREKKRKAGVYISVAFLLLQLLLVLGRTAMDTLFGPVLAEVVLMIGIGVAITAGIWLAAYFKDFPRGYVYGVLYGIAFSCAFLFDQPIAFVGPGAIILLIGLVVFVRFVCQYPAPAEGELLA
jgi:hypothetical protein